MDTNTGSQNNVEKYRVDGMSLKNKMDKIAAAIHMVTDCIEDNEPIRFKLRSLSIELASESHQLVHTPPRDRGFVFADIEIVATEIMSFISVAKSVRLMSEMNADILLRELSANTERMRTWTETGFYEVEDPSFAQVSKPASFTLSDSHFTTDQAIKNTTQPQATLPVAQSGMSFIPKTTDIHKGHIQTNQPVPATKRQESVDNKKFDVAIKLNRRNAILKIIKDKKEVTIKDISIIIGDCSEKTIQRELSTLVEDGVLKKVGEKRWSKYMLA